VICEDLAARAITDRIDLYRGNDMFWSIPVHVVSEDVEKANKLSRLPLNFKPNFSSATPIVIYAKYYYV